VAQDYIHIVQYKYPDIRSEEASRHGSRVGLPGENLQRGLSRCDLGTADGAVMVGQSEYGDGKDGVVGDWIGKGQATKTSRNCGRN
jgi:hypothetical protein